MLVHICLAKAIKLTLQALMSQSIASSPIACWRFTTKPAECMPRWPTKKQRAGPAKSRLWTRRFSTVPQACGPWSCRRCRMVLKTTIVC